MPALDLDPSVCLRSTRFGNVYTPASKANPVSPHTLILSATNSSRSHQYVAVTLAKRRTVMLPRAAILPHVLHFDPEHSNHGAIGYFAVAVITQLWRALLALR
jgi:hypothetical protein